MKRSPCLLILVPLALGRLRGRTNDGNDDYDHAGSDNDAASSRGTGDETSASGSR
jgi:hypothetical protein